MPLRDRYVAGKQSAQSRSQRFLNGPTVVVLGLILTLLGGGGILFYKASGLRRSVDSVSLCLTGEPPTSVDVILLDLSDGFTSTQKLQVLNHLERHRRQVPKYGLIEVHSINGGDGPPTRLVYRSCNPGSGEEMNRLYQNPALAKRRWNEFARRMRGEIDSAMTNAGANRSPILEAIQSTAASTFGLPDNDGVPKRLVLVSDLLQHMPGEFSMYAGLPSFEQFRATPYFTKVRSDLSDVDVSVVLLVRAESRISRSDQVTFWEALFTAEGAALTNVETVFGDR